MKNLIKLGFALSNSGLVQDIEKEVIAQNPTYTQPQIDAKVLEVRQVATLFNKPNKKAYKPTVGGAKGERLTEIQSWIREANNV